MCSASIITNFESILDISRDQCHDSIHITDSDIYDKLHVCAKYGETRKNVEGDYKKNFFFNIQNC